MILPIHTAARTHEFLRNKPRSFVGLAPLALFRNLKSSTSIEYSATKGIGGVTGVILYFFD